MVSTSDFIILTYTPDLTLAGLTYACKRFTLFNLPGNTPPISQLMQMIADTGIELAIRRHLIKERIPHRYAQVKHFTDPDHPTLTIGGRRCAIFNTIISKKWQIKEVRTKPLKLLDMPAMVLQDQTEMHYLNDDDIFIFGFLNSLLTTTQHSITQALDAGQPTFQIKLLPPPWSRCSSWHSLGTLTCQYEEKEKICLEIGGLSSDRKYLTETLILSSGTESFCNKDFFYIHYLSTKDYPKGKISLTSSTLKLTHIIQSHEWRNIWIYGLEIILVGFITRGEFFNQAQMMSVGNHPFDFRTRLTKYFSIPVSKLASLPELFNRAKSWTM